MSDQELVRTEVDALLADLPDPDAADVDLDQVASGLEAAHDVLVHALESVEKG